MTSRVGIRRVCAATLASAALALLAAGCGSVEEGRPEEPTAAATSGQKVFVASGCGGCHTLAHADAGGQAGPNLDQLQPSADRVMRAVRDGRTGMPSFGPDRIDDKALRALAEYVEAQAGG
jgi:sulfite dehydrogenase